MSQGRRAGYLLAVVAIALARAAAAQTNSEVNAGIQFNFSEPGARSLGMGGAFIGLADDATAAYTNPAGLTILSQPEVSLEARNWGFTHVFTDRGRLDGSPTGVGVDNVAGLRNGAAENDVTGLSFLSVVYPHPRKSWVLAIYRHELAHFEADFQAQGAFLTGGLLSDSRLYPTANHLRLEIVNLGLSAALQVTSNLSMGVGISRYDFSMDSQTLRYGFFFLPEDTSPGGFYGPPLYEDTYVITRQSQKGKGNAVGINVGFNWRVSQEWQLGGVFRQGPRFKFVASDKEAGFEEQIRDVDFAIPDVFGLGFAFQPTEISTFTLDVVQVEYSDLTDAFVVAFVDPDTGLVGGRDDRLLVDDAYEVHLGVERFVRISKAQLALRAGAWLDPDHRLRYEGFSQARRALFRRGEDEVHYSVGLGVVFDKFQVDAAFDLSDRVSTASLSTVARF